MSSDNTLIIFDTNALYDGEQVNYSIQEVWGSLKQVIDFIDEYQLRENVQLALPQMVISELVSLTNSDFKSCLSKINTNFERIRSIGNWELKTKQGDFDFLEHMHSKLHELINAHEIRVIDYPPNDRFPLIIKRAIRKKSPFKTSTNVSDKGFKDVVIWESILSYQEILEYRNFILFTNNKEDFDGVCKAEFYEWFHRDIFILGSTDEVIDKLRQIHSIADEVPEKPLPLERPDSDEFDQYYKWTSQEYFSALLMSELGKKKKIRIIEKDTPISSFQIKDKCEKIQKEVGENGIETGIYIIFSRVIIQTAKAEYPVIAKTYIDEVMDHQFTEFEPELLE